MSTPRTLHFMERTMLCLQLCSVTGQVVLTAHAQLLKHCCERESFVVDFRCNYSYRRLKKICTLSSSVQRDLSAYYSTRSVPSPSSRDATQSSYSVLCSQALGKVKSKVNVFRPLSPPSPTQSCLEVGRQLKHSPSLSVFSKLKRGRTRTATRTLHPAAADGGGGAISLHERCTTPTDVSTS